MRKACILIINFNLLSLIYITNYIYASANKRTIQSTKLQCVDVSDYGRVWPKQVVLAAKTSQCNVAVWRSHSYPSSKQMLLKWKLYVKINEGCNIICV
jgi:hypothetical protein